MLELQLGGCRVYGCAEEEEQRDVKVKEVRFLYPQKRIGWMVLIFW
jgi:hypothetical protein